MKKRFRNQTKGCHYENREFFQFYDVFKDQKKKDRMNKNFNFPNSIEVYQLKYPGLLKDDNARFIHLKALKQSMETTIKMRNNYWNWQ